MRVSIIDYKTSNLHSVKAACEKVGITSSITSKPNELLSSDAAILPGVGSFSGAMQNIRKLGLEEAIFNFVSSGKPLFGICLGLQLLFEQSEEFGTHEGLSLIRGKVKRFDFSNGTKISDIKSFISCSSASKIIFSLVTFSFPETTLIEYHFI